MFTILLMKCYILNALTHQYIHVLEKSISTILLLQKGWHLVISLGAVLKLWVVFLIYQIQMYLKENRQINQKKRKKSDDFCSIYIPCRSKMKKKEVKKKERKTINWKMLTVKSHSNNLAYSTEGIIITKHHDNWRIYRESYYQKSESYTHLWKATSSLKLKQIFTGIFLLKPF